MVGTEKNVSQVQELANKIRENVQKAIVGKDEAINIALVALLCKGHILVEDVPGIGKTTLGKALSASLGCSFKRIQFTPDLMPNDVLGVNFFNQKSSEFEFRPGPIFSQVILADEINRATPRTQSALLEAMQETQVTIEGMTMELPQPFLVISTQNPVELEGTFPLPEAQLDRFMVRVVLGYPTPHEEGEIYLRFDRNTMSTNLKPVVEPDEIRRVQEIPPTVKIDSPVRSYIVDLINRTRNHPGISLGASPRAGLALYKTAQAWAAIDGRDFVIPDDVKTLAYCVLPHRIILSSTARLRGNTAEHILEEILTEAPVPIER